MNDYSTKLYNNLENLTKQTKCFKSKIHTSKSGRKYKIFTYYINASYEKWQLPDALECRGHMFEMTFDGKQGDGGDHDHDVPIRLASLPPEKFFNINENPFTMDLNLENSPEKIDLIMEKRDGSLISTFLELDGDGEAKLFLKTKNSLPTSQCVDAMNLLTKNENWANLHNELVKLEKLNFTVNLEYTAPDNKIVLEYKDAKLVVLNIRSREDGRYVRLQDILDESGSITAKNFPEIVKNFVIHHNFNKSPQEISNFIKNYKTQEGIEGYVIRLKSGLQMKLKTDWYFIMHKMHKRCDDMSDQDLYKS